jgi:hypothetical protein
MGKIFVNVGMSLDGYLAPEGMTLRIGASIMGKRMFESPAGRTRFQQYMNAGLVDELEIALALAPVIFGGGRPPAQDRYFPVHGSALRLEPPDAGIHRVGM